MMRSGYGVGLSMRPSEQTKAITLACQSQLHPAVAYTRSSEGRS